MKNRKSSMRVGFGKYGKSIGMKVKEVVLSTQIKTTVEILTLLSVIFVFSKSIFLGF